MSAWSLENKIDGYVLQMAIKLFVANIVETQFYVTLDADIILLRSFEYQDIIISVRNDTGEIIMERGLYENEPREVHANWWVHSSRLLKLTGVDDQIVGTADGGFGVTPAILSVWGSHIVLDRLRTIYGKDMLEKTLLENFNNNIWTEYTSYALLLHDYGAFDTLHVEQNMDGRKLLHCNDVWYKTQLPWNARV